MSERQTAAEQLIADFTENYIEKIFYFCLKKTGNGYEAEELAQDISLNVLMALNKGTVPEIFPAWIWKIAYNRYSRWADNKAKKLHYNIDMDISDAEVENENNTLDLVIHHEQLALLRRELAFIKTDYRKIIVAYYIENHSISDIAKSLSVSENTIWQRMYRARKMLKEGMNMVREFGGRSYNPDEVDFVINCPARSTDNQPYNVLEHILYHNILLEAYDNPSTAEELSMKLGVALPYMENELDYLTRETFLTKENRYYTTNFLIISCHLQEQVHDIQLSCSPILAEAMMQFVDRLNSAFSSKGYAYYGIYSDYESAKWTLLMLVFDYYSYKPPQAYETTTRPNCGKWDITGYQHCDLKKAYAVGKHGGPYGFWQFKYLFSSIADRTPPFLTEKEAKTLRNIALGEVTPAADTADVLAEYGYIQKQEDKYVPNFLVLDLEKIKNTAETFDAESFSDLQASAAFIRNEMRKLYERIAETVRKDIPRSYLKNSHPYLLAVSSFYCTRRYVMEQAIKSGWLCSPEQASRTVGAHLYI